MSIAKDILSDDDVRELARRTMKELMNSEEASFESIDKLYQAMQSAYDDMMIERINSGG